MKFIWLHASLAATLALVGCAPQGLFYKPGALVARADRDLLACRVSAENTVPARMITRVLPGPPLPPRQVCTATGCRMVPSGFVPPRIVTEDANAGLRQQVVTQCMADQGYAFVRIPQCPANVSRTVTPTQTTVMPRLTENACILRGTKGSWQIVTPG